MRNGIAISVIAGAAALAVILGTTGFAALGWPDAAGAGVRSTMSTDGSADASGSIDTSGSTIATLAPEPVLPTVPCVLNLAEATAVSRTRSAGLLAVLSHGWSKTREGRIYKQSVKGGTRLAAGSRLTLWVSDGPAPAWHRVVASVYDEPQALAARAARYTGPGDKRHIVANKTLPLGTIIELTYKGRTTRAIVLDRGPYVGGRSLDLAYATHRALRFRCGVGKLSYRVVGHTKNWKPKSLKALYLWG